MRRATTHGMTEREYPREMGTESDRETLMRDMHLRR
jgi:hypothetical protein